MTETSDNRINNIENSALDDLKQEAKKLMDAMKDWSLDDTETQEILKMWNIKEQLKALVDSMLKWDWFSFEDKNSYDNFKSVMDKFWTMDLPSYAKIESQYLKKIDKKDWEWNWATIGSLNLNSNWISIQNQKGESFDIDYEQISADDLKSMHNLDFLELDFKDRLRHISKDKIDSEQISNGEVKDIEFTFIFDGTYNRDLFLKTTAWQVLPEEAWSVSMNWQEYSRAWLRWEFFSWNNRLVIHEWTKIEVSKLRDSEEIASLKSWFSDALDKIKDPDERLISAWALERDIKPDIVMDLFKKIISKTPDDEKSVKLEDLFTQMERVRWDYNLDKNSKQLKEALFDEDWDWNIDSFSKFNGKIDFSNLEIRDWERWLLDLISIFESRWNYEAYNAWTKWTWGKLRHSWVMKWLSDMSLSEMISRSERYDGNNPNRIFAAGKYQIIPDTLEKTAKSIWLPMSAKFTPENQDKMWLYLLKMRWLDKFLSWAMSVEQFQLNLAKERASLPKDMTWRSFYAWDWVNKAHLWADKLRSHLLSMRS